MITHETRPRLASKARLRWDRHSRAYLLLYPESGLILNPTASDILLRCSGDQTIGSIINALGCRYLGCRREDVEQDVVSFLQAMIERGLVRAEC
jgi:coenzyme PQQ biosynthesis protein PqqD